MEVADPGSGALTQLIAPPGRSDELYRHLVRRYLQSSAVAALVTCFLAIAGLEWTAYQVIVFVLLPVAVLFFVIPDIYVIRRQYRPIGVALSFLERGGTPSPEAASAALARALNLPFYAFLRVVFLHGPLAAIAMFLIQHFGGMWLGVRYEPWQVFVFAAMILVFTGPFHGILEYFYISRDLAGPIMRLSRFAPAGILQQHRRHVVAVSLRWKLLYLSVFVAALPLLFFVLSVAFKVDLLLEKAGARPTADDIGPLWLWLAAVTMVIAAGAITVAVLTAREVSRSAQALLAAMHRVEAGELHVQLGVTATDEYADLFRGFNLMTAALREEVRLLEVTSALAAEVSLERLIARIMKAAAELLDADRATLFLHDPKSGELQSTYADGLETRAIRMPADRGIAGAVFTSGRTENLVDAYEDVRFYDYVDRATGYRTQSLLCVPIVNKAGVRIGVTQVLNKKSGAGFNQKDEMRLKAFASQIAISLENARLFQEVVKEKNYNESILRSTSNGIITLSNEATVVSANDTALSILKVERERLIGHPVDAFVARNAWVGAAFARVRRSGETDISVDADLSLAAGSVAVNLTVTPLRGLGGESLGLLAVFDDISAERRLRSMLSRYVSKEVADQLLAVGDAQLGGKDQRVSTFFGGISNFASISETLDTRGTVALLNDYFREMVEVVFQRSGILDKYVGETFMALFGAPFVRPEDPDQAISAAMEMTLALKRLNQDRRNLQSRALEMGVGIATGNVVVGNIGATKRMEYTVIGDSVNLAARLQSANKFYGTSILVSEATVQALKKPPLLREIDLLRVRGKEHAAAIYEVVDAPDVQRSPALEDAIVCFERGRAAYRERRWNEAARHFGKALELKPRDGPSCVYLDRCAHYRDQPPPASWDGVWTMREKVP
jgi:adenylate cyclase